MSDSPPNDYDVVLLHGPTEDGDGVRVLRARPGQLEAGEVRPARDGRPLNGAEMVTLKPREGTPSVCDVEVVHAPQKPPSATRTSTPRVTEASDRHGPAQVATAAYRAQWELVFGKRARDGEPS